jgi:hypothetical protein
MDNIRLLKTRKSRKRGLFMKKMLLLIVVITLMFSLCSCTKMAPVTTTPAPASNAPAVTYSTANIVGGWSSSNETFYFDDQLKSQDYYGWAYCTKGFDEDDGGPMYAYKATRLGPTTFNIYVYNAALSNDPKPQLVIVTDGNDPADSIIWDVTISFDSNDQIEMNDSNGGVTTYKRIPVAMAKQIFNLTS